MPLWLAAVACRCGLPPRDAGTTTDCPPPPSHTLPLRPAHKATPLYLHPGGVLAHKTAPACPTGDCATSYLYDPTNPAPTLGGNNLFGTCGPYDQRSVEARPDTVTFTTAAMSDAVAFVGPVSAVLYVRSNCTDTDFVAKLSDGACCGGQAGGIRAAGMTPPSTAAQCTRTAAPFW